MVSVSSYYYGNIFDTDANNILKELSPIIEPNIQSYIEKFYSVLLSDPASAQFLDNHLVEIRLKKQLEKWLKETLSPKREDQVQDSLRSHLKVGEVHSRVEIPMPLVDAGMTIIKEGIIHTVLSSNLALQQTIDSVILVNKILDAAMSLINESYLRGKVAHERTSQEFITASSAQELALEIERIKSSIYQWMTSNLIAFPNESKSFSESIKQKDFGLWIKHKLPLIVSSSKRLEKINTALDSSDQHRATLHAQGCKANAEDLNTLKQILQELIWHLTEEANSNLAKESKQDALTTLLERRFLDPILQQETQMAINGGPPYSIIMIDLDHFKRVNDLYGHQAGDAVLRQCCRLIKENIRLTDYAFRYGGEEMLIVAPEMGKQETIKLAERMRKTIHDTSIVIADSRSINVTASFGVASFSGHPDYQNLINEADSNLYAAKQAGRNCIRG